MCKTRAKWVSMANWEPEVMHHQRSGFYRRSGTCWILLVSFLASVATACNASQNGAPKGVRLDIAKLLGKEAHREVLKYVWLKPVAHVRDLPKAVKSRIGREITDPGGA